MYLVANWCFRIVVKIFGVSELCSGDPAIGPRLARYQPPRPQLFGHLTRGAVLLFFSQLLPRHHYRFSIFDSRGSG